MDHKTLPGQSSTRDPGFADIKPWDRPFIYTTEDLHSLLLFLSDEEAKGYALSNVTAYSPTVRVTGPDNSSVLYTTSVLKASRDKRYALYETLRSYPRYMSQFLREKLFSHVGWFFSLRKLQ